MIPPVETSRGLERLRAVSGPVDNIQGMSELYDVVVEIADRSPWSGDYDHDWCFFCYAGQEEYGPKPWSGHKQDCLWVRTHRILGRPTDHLVLSE